jgi:hypothetical protein
MQAVSAEPTIMLMFIIAIIVLGGIFILAGGVHLLVPLLHHFGLIALGLLALALLGFLFVGWHVAPQSTHVTTINASGQQTTAIAYGDASSSAPTWASSLKILIIAVAVIGAIVALAHKRVFAHPHVLGVGGLIFAVLVVLTVLGLYFARSDLSHRAAVAARSSVPAPSGWESYRVSGSSDSSTTHIPIDSSAEKKPEAETNPPEGVQGSEPKDANLPAWVNQPPHWKDANSQVFVIVVRSGLVADPNLLEEQLDNKMVARTNKYIEEQVLRRSGAGDIAGFDADYLREHCIRQRYPSDGNDSGAKELFAQLEFDRAFRDEANRRYHEFVSTERLQQTGGIAAAAFAVLGGLYLFLRTTGRKQTN